MKDVKIYCLKNHFLSKGTSVTIKRGNHRSLGRVAKDFLCQENRNIQGTLRNRFLNEKKIFVNYKTYITDLNLFFNEKCTDPFG